MSARVQPVERANDARSPVQLAVGALTVNACVVVQNSLGLMLLVTQKVGSVVVERVGC